MVRVGTGKLDRFGELKQVDALDGSSVPVLGVDDIAGDEVTGIHPALALHLERMCFGTLNDLTVNVIIPEFALYVNVYKNSALQNEVRRKAMPNQESNP
mgnify:CR=1 FL=1